MKKKLLELINDPKDPIKNFYVGKEYEDLGQNSSALSYYLRAAEFSRESLLAYESLIRIAIILDKQGSRYASAISILMRALSLYPSRPEAYFILTKLYEKTRDWQHCYAMACIGETLLDENIKSFISNIDYHGKYAFTFQRAVSAWWIGLTDESVALFRKLEKNSEVSSSYLAAVKNNLKNTENIYKRLIKYDKEQYKDLRFKFEGAEKIEHNYSQIYQDMFILSMLNGKEYGSFIEIGCGYPFMNNNTALLQKEYNWFGVSIDIDEDVVSKFREERKGTVIHGDALKIDFNNLLTDTYYDYLQIDCDPAINSYEILLRIPFNKCRFAVITFEHDYYLNEYPDVKEKSRKYLRSFGYELVVNNLAEDRWSDFEDWWVHPELVDKKILDIMKCVSDDVKRADLYMLDKLR